MVGVGTVHPVALQPDVMALYVDNNPLSVAASGIANCVDNKDIKHVLQTQDGPLKFLSIQFQSEEVDLLGVAVLF